MNNTVIHKFKRCSVVITLVKRANGWIYGLDCNISGGGTGSGGSSYGASHASKFQEPSKTQDKATVAALSEAVNHFETDPGKYGAEKPLINEAKKFAAILREEIAKLQLPTKPRGKQIVIGKFVTVNSKTVTKSNDKIKTVTKVPAVKSHTQLFDELGLTITGKQTRDYYSLQEVIEYFELQISDNPLETHYVPNAAIFDQHVLKYLRQLQSGNAPTKTVTKHCLHCTKELQDKNAKALYCNTACRVAYFRKNKPLKIAA
jgi:hypothetical protein